MTTEIPLNVAIVGSGPAALMAAHLLSLSTENNPHGRIRVRIFEKRKACGRKLLVAGSSGLNISNSLPLQKFASHYSGDFGFWKGLLRDFSPKDWLGFIESLGLETFEGTSGRYFIRDMKASRLLRIWMDRLKSQGVQIQLDHECIGFDRELRLKFSNGAMLSFDRVLFALGGGSWEPLEKPLRWPEIFKQHRLQFEEFTPSNVGYRIDWPEGFVKEAEGLPLKNIELTSSRGSKKGDAVITSYGLEGTPVYFAGMSGKLHLDLKPDLTQEQLLKKCRSLKENLSPIRRVKKQLALSPAALALLYHLTPRETLDDLPRLVERIKRFPVHFRQSQGLDEAISSAGGLDLSELDENLMLKKFPGVYAAGEMLNWDAPTGGFLIQGCVSQGARAAWAILKSI